MTIRALAEKRSDTQKLPTLREVYEDYKQIRPHYALKRLANHSSGDDVTAGYIIVSPERLREPMERIENKLLQLCGAEMRF